MVLVVYFDMRLYYSSDYDNCGQNDVETLSKTDQWNIGVQDNPIYEKYGHMEICP